jgi:FkbM family methyltransferase
MLNGHTKEVLEDSHVNCVLDVGANVGQYGDFVRELGYLGQIISFEPVASTFAELERHTSADSNWRAVRTALGQRTGEVSINVTRSSPLASLRTPLTDVPARLAEGIQVDRRETTTLRRLDEIFADYVTMSSPLVLLKLDTQGWDLEVLRGATGCLDKVVAIQSEVSVLPLYEGMPAWLESMAFIHELGFEPTGLFPVSYATGVHVVEFDCMMVRFDPFGPDRSRGS